MEVRGGHDEAAVQEQARTVDQLKRNLAAHASVSLPLVSQSDQEEKMHSSARYSSCFCLVVILLMAASLSAAPTKEITFDHSSGVLSPGGPVALGRDDVLTIHVTHTFNGCFQFLTTLTPAPVGAERSGEPLVNIDVPVRYDGKAAGITLSIKYLPGLLPERRAICEELPERDVQIPVENLAWTLGFAGAVTADSRSEEQTS